MNISKYQLDLSVKIRGTHICLYFLLWRIKFSFQNYVILYTFSILTQPALLVQSQQQKHPDNVFNLFKVNNKDNRTRSTLLTIVNFKQISHIVLVFLLLALNK